MQSHLKEHNIDTHRIQKQAEGQSRRSILDRDKIGKGEQSENQGNYIIKSKLGQTGRLLGKWRHIVVALSSDCRFLIHNHHPRL